MIGKGTNVWDGVHIDDLVDLYLKIFELAQRNENEPVGQASPYSRFYFGSTASFEWGVLIKKLAGMLYSRGLVENADVVSLRVEDEPKLSVT